MPEQLLTSYSASLFSGSTVAASASGTGTTLPLADSYAFILDVGTITGTSPTFDVCIQTSPDGGTTWYDWWRFAQVTAAGQRRLIVQPIQGRGEAGSEAAITSNGTGALNANAPIQAAQARVHIQVGGTSPSAATLKVWLIASPRATQV